MSRKLTPISGVSAGDGSSEKSRSSREAVLGLKTATMVTASEIVKELTSDDLLLMYKTITQELALRQGEVPTQEEMWLVEHGDKLSAIMSVRRRLGCDLSAALKILSIA